VLRRPVESRQYTSIRYSERLQEAGIAGSVGSVDALLDLGVAGCADLRDLQVAALTPAE